MIVPTTNDFLKTPHDESLFESFNESITLNAIIVDVIEVFTERGVALVSHPEFEKNRLVAYTPESGIIDGAAAILQIASGQPKIVGVAYFGARKSNSYLFDVEEDDKSKKLEKNISENPDDSFEDVISRALIIKHEAGEKVYHNKFSGTKCGNSLTTVFFGLHSRLELGLKHATLESQSAGILAGTGEFLVEEDENTGVTRSKLSMSDDIDGFLRPIYKEYRGDVSSSISEDDIEITETILSIPNLKDVIQLDMAIDYDTEKYKHEFKDVKHEFKNRKLTVDGSEEKTGSTMINSTLKSKSNSTFSDSRAIKGKHGSRNISITFLRAIDVFGNIFEFNAGDSKKITLGTSTSIDRKKKSFILEDSYEYTQESTFSSSLPTKTNNIHVQEKYGTEIIASYGKVNRKSYNIETIINTSTNTSYSKGDGEIEAFEVHESPDFIFKGRKKAETYKESDGEKPTHSITIESNDGNKISKEMIISGSPVEICTYKGQNSKSSTNIGESEFSLNSSAQINFKGKSVMMQSDLMTVDSKLSVTKGFMTGGDFIVNAENIYLNAKKNMIASSNDSMQFSSGRIIMNASKQFVAIGARNLTDKDGKSLSTPMLVLDKTSVLTSEFVGLVAADSAIISAKENISFSAKIVSGAR